MNLPDDEKKELLADAHDITRRDHFRRMKSPHPKTFEEYIAILDDIQKLHPAPKRREPIDYKNVLL